MLTANGSRFHVAVTGDGPLVLLVHGFPTFWWTWRHQLTSLASAGFTAAAVDLRGYGASDKPPRGYDPIGLATDLAGVVRSLGTSQATVVGHGWGGVLGWTLAVTNPGIVRRLAVVSAPHPRRLRAEILTSPAQARAVRRFVDYQWPWMPERRLVAAGSHSVGELLATWSATTWPPAPVKQTFQDAMTIPGVAHASLEYFRWAFRSAVRRDGLRYARTMGAAVGASVLAVHGSSDPLMLPATARGSQRYVAGTYQWHELAGVGHFPHEEAPQRFDDILLDWLAQPGA
ncbi:MAG: alpha/beta fold hydrolase [Actinomycetes bacterium]